MDSSEIKVEMEEVGLLEPLIIIEEGDVTQGVPERGAVSSSAAGVQSCSGESVLKEEEEKHAREYKNEDNVAAKLCLEPQRLDKQEADAKDELTGGVNEEDKQEKDKPDESMNGGQNRGAAEREEQTNEEMRITEIPEKPCVTEDEEVTKNDPEVDTDRLNSAEQQAEGTETQEEDPKKAHRLTPDFPEALYELLCSLQEGRRLNDQRCSFKLESGVRRRRCHSEPNTTKPANRVIFSSMTSLQKEEFFELVATAQARRLDDQRAQLERSPLPKSKARSFRGSIKQLSFVRKPVPDPAPVPVPVRVPEEALYNMIRTSQAQGRLEDQRSSAPGPMDDEDFFSLLLKVQGGRMDEQRTELPCILQT